MLDILIAIKGKFNQFVTIIPEHLYVPEDLRLAIKGVGRYLFVGALGLTLGFSLIVLLIIAPVNLVQRFVSFTSFNSPEKDSGTYSGNLLEEDWIALQKELQKAQAKLASFTPVKPYLVVNTTTNTFQLYNPSGLVREGKCSTGSYVKLQGNDREWIFKTPKGYHMILGKAKNPVWKKPDWAFIEEGMEVPSANHNSRFEYGVLGDYALYMGDGYMIHGTLYQRLLGLPVTHGCIRLGDDDLEAVYKTLGPRSKVFIL